MSPAIPCRGEIGRLVYSPTKKKKAPTWGLCCPSISANQVTVEIAGQRGCWPSTSADPVIWRLLAKASL